MSRSSASSSSKSAEEDVSASSSEALEEVNGHIKDVFEILKRETMKVRREMDAFDSVAKKLKHVHFSKTLKLNVGGQLFSTSLETMKKDPGNIFYCIFRSNLLAFFILSIQSARLIISERQKFVCQ